MLNESEPAWLRIADLTDAFNPWMSDTTAMIDVTATILPSTVISERSLADQMALSAMAAASRYLFIAGRRWPISRSASRIPVRVRVGLHPHRVAVGHAADAAVRARDDLVAGLGPRKRLEIAIAGDADLDRQELRASFLDQEDTFGFFPRLSRLAFGPGPGPPPGALR